VLVRPGHCFEAPSGVLGAYSAPPNAQAELQGRKKGRGRERKKVRKKGEEVK